MICQFSFENYKAFKEESLLDFTAEGIGEYKDSIIEDSNKKEKVVPVIAVYGPNGGGKSTVLEALGFLRDTILRYIIITKMQDDDRYDIAMQKWLSAPSKDICYKLAPEYQEAPTKFDIIFLTSEKKFRYQLSIKKNRIVEENLYYQKGKSDDVIVVFERSEEECILGVEIEDIAVEKVSDSMPLLSHIAISYDIETIDEAVEWFLQIEMLNYDNPKNEKRIVLPKSNEKRRRLFLMLEEMDIAIKDIRVEKDEDGNVRNIYTKHLMENGKYCEIRLEDESSGTRKLLSCLTKIEK